MPVVDGARRARLWSQALVCIAATLVASACSKKHAAESAVVEDDIAAFEAALTRNHHDLVEAGVDLPALAHAMPVQSEAAGAAPPPAMPDAAAPAESPAAAEPEAEESAPAADAAPEPALAGDDASRENRQRRRVSDPGERRRCDRICELAEIACDLETRVCHLASRHAGDRRYRDACARAQTQCTSAADACRACAP